MPTNFNMDFGNSQQMGPSSSYSFMTAPSKDYMNYLQGQRNIDFNEEARRKQLDASLGASTQERDYRHQMELQKLKSNPMMEFLSMYRTQQKQPVVGDLSSLLSQYRDAMSGQGAQQGMQRNWQTIASILGR